MSKILLQAKRHPEIVPVLVITFGACTLGTYQIFRSATTYTDVSFRRKSNPHPWLHVKPSDNFKAPFFRSADYSKVVQDERPKYE